MPKMKLFLYLKNDENCEESKVQCEKIVLKSPILTFLRRAFLQDVF